MSVRIIINGGLSAFIAGRLIPLDKDPGLRPIGIGEVLRRIIGKMVVFVLKPDLQEDAGDLQMCVGQPGGCEAGVHAMRDIFQDESTHNLQVGALTHGFSTPTISTRLTDILKCTFGVKCKLASH